MALAKRHGHRPTRGRRARRRTAQDLLRDDAYSYRVANTDPRDAGLRAAVRASSQHPDGAPERLLDGQQRNRPELRPEFIQDKKTNPPPEDGIFRRGQRLDLGPAQRGRAAVGRTRLG